MSRSDFGAERLEPLGHERAARVLARRDVVLLHLDVAGRAAQREARGVLARDHAGERFALLGRHVPLPEARIDFAVRIDDVREQLGAAVGAHAVQRRTDLALSEVAQLVAARARAGEEGRPFAASPGFSISGSSAAMMSLFAFPPGQRVEERARPAAPPAGSDACAAARRWRGRGSPA